MVKEDKSTIVFQVRFWNPKHYTDIDTKNKDRRNIYNGVIVRSGMKNEHFHSAGELLKKLEKEWWKVARR